MKISEAQAAVASFHEKLQISPRAVLSRDDGSGNSMLWDIAVILKNQADKLEERCEYPRANRAHLLIEEVSECVDAMADGDEIKLLDGLADLLYIVLGTAETFDLPLEAAFEEVHRSNMTKEKQPDDPSAARVRQKGPNYKPPNIAEVLKRHRNLQSRTFDQWIAHCESINNRSHHDEHGYGRCGPSCVIPLSVLS